MTDKPTDEALENLFVEETGFDPDDFPAAIFGFARAVLEKWGTHLPAPATQQPEWEPMTDEQVRAMLNKHPPEDVCGWSYRMGIDDAELHHGIKGGQHGTE